MAEPPAGGPPALTEQDYSDTHGTLSRIADALENVARTFRGAVDELDTLVRYRGVSDEARAAALRRACELAEGLPKELEKAAPAAINFAPDGALELRSILDGAGIPIVGGCAGGVRIRPWDYWRALRVVRAVSAARRRGGKAKT